MTTSTTRSRFPLVLKTIIADAVSDKTIPAAIADNRDYPKKVRAKLRVALRDSHLLNTSWVATSQAEYDAMRSAFDPLYAASLVKPAKAKAPRKPKARKADAAPAAADAE